MNSRLLNELPLRVLNADLAKICTSILLVCLPLSLSVAAQKTNDKECGATAAFIACATYRPESTSFAKFLAELGPASDQGYSIAQLEAILRSRSLHTLSLQTSLTELRARRKRADFVTLVRLSNKHYAILDNFESSSISVLDFPRSYAVSEGEFERSWQPPLAILVSEKELEVPYTSYKLYLGLAGLVLVTSLTVAYQLRKRR